MTHEFILKWYSLTSASVVKLTHTRLIVNAKQPIKNGNAQEAVMVVLSYGSVFQLTTETVAIFDTKWRRTYCNDDWNYLILNVHSGPSL